VGVDIEVVVKDLDAIKSKVGISEAEVHEFDNLQKDYAQKYDAACRDVTARPPRMNQAEYTCLRRNMDTVLDSIRAFVQAIEAAKSIADPSAQKEIIFRALDDMRTAYNAKYRAGCTSAMSVEPKSLTFDDSIPQRSVEVTNFGNNDFTFSVMDLPECFVFKADRLTLPRGEFTSVRIFRTIIPPPANGAVSFHVRNNLQDDEVVKIVLDGVNASLYENWGKELQSAMVVGHKEPTAEDAVRIVERSLPAEMAPADRDAFRYYFAAGVLTRIGKNAEARRALDVAIGKDPSLERQPATLMLRGVALYHEGKPDGALRAFADARQLAGPSDSEAKSAADLFTGAILLNRGDRAAASQHLSNSSVQKQVALSPDLLKFAEHEFKTPDLATAIKGGSNAANPRRNAVPDDQGNTRPPASSSKEGSSRSSTPHPRAQEPSRPTPAPQPRTDKPTPPY